MTYGNWPTLFLALGACVFSTAPCIGQVSRQTPAKALHLTLELASQSYCTPETFPAAVPPTVEIELSFRLRIENVSDHDVILCEHCALSDGSRLFAALPHGITLISDYQSDRFGFPRKVHYPGRPNGRYPVLKPGGVLNTEATALLLGILDSQYPPRTGGISNGKFSLEESFDMFWERPEVVKSLAQQWKRYGDLYAGSLIADPIPLQIQIPGKVALCR